jgi:YggT family protein
MADLLHNIHEAIALPLWVEIMALALVALSPMVEVAQGLKLARVGQMIRLLLFVDDLLGFYTFVLLVTVVVSWLIAFDVINIRNGVVRSVLHVLSALTDPVLAPIRRLVPPIGGLDLSFLVPLLLIQLVRSVLIPDLADVLR